MKAQKAHFGRSGGDVRDGPCGGCGGRGRSVGGTSIGSGLGGAGCGDGVGLAGAPAGAGAAGGGACCLFLLIRSIVFLHGSFEPKSG